VSRIARFITWICSRFTRAEIEQTIAGLSDVLQNRNPDAKPMRPTAGFNSQNGGVVLTTLFVTHYNFLRPHMSLNYKPPVQLPDLEAISTIQGKWAKILSLAA
jgi:transposase InsO family protein